MRQTEDRRAWGVSPTLTKITRPGLARSAAQTAPLSLNLAILRKTEKFKNNHFQQKFLISQRFLNKRNLPKHSSMTGCVRAHGFAGMVFINFIGRQVP